MKIVITTPLYPPDVAEPAPYVKELAMRLRDTDEVTIIAYNHIPEKIPGVKIVTIQKQFPMPIRLLTFTIALFKLSKEADVIYSQNGQSTELPLSIVSLLRNKPFVLRLGDEAALGFTQKKFALRLIQRFAIRRAQANITHSDTTTKTISSLAEIDTVHQMQRPHSRPEILPFVSTDEAILNEFEQSWVQHVNELRAFFKHVIT